jgi:hypothetical protein
MGGSVRLRYNRRTIRWLLGRYVLSVPVFLLGGWVVAVRSHTTFLTGAAIMLAGWAVLVTVSVLVYWGTRYRIRGDLLLARGLRPADVDLPGVRHASLFVRVRGSRRSRSVRLVLTLDSMSIRLGESAAPCYFRPDGLRGLAAALARSPEPGVRQAARALRTLADQPDHSSWPT